MKDVSNVQVLRGLAALGVVVAHAQGELIYRDAPNPLPSLEWGAFGVDVFFVISGFVMAYTSAVAFGSLKAVWPFAIRRIVRVVPLYWIATLAFGLLLARQADTLSDLRILGRHALQSMGFWPSVDGATPILPPGWTLNYEMAFYVCFAAVLPFRRGPALVTLAVGLTALGFAGTFGWLPERLAVIANLQVMEFVAGLAIAEARLAGWRVPPRVGLPLAAVALLAIVPTAPLSDALSPWRGFVWGLPAALIVGGLALAPETPAVAPSRLRRTLERLGDASYSIYLTHFVVNTTFVPWLFERLTVTPKGALAYFFVLLAADAPVCWFVYRYVETPLMRRLKRRRRDRRTEAAALAPA